MRKTHNSNKNKHRSAGCGGIHLPITRESINESYCKQAFRLIVHHILPPSRFSPVTLQEQATRLWKYIPYIRLRDSTGFAPVFLSSLSKSTYASVADTYNVFYAVLMK